MQLDMLDRKLIYYLDQNARTSLSRIAKKLCISRNVALYRYNRLQELGIIKGTFADINNAALGYHSFRIFFKLGNFEKSFREELFDYVGANKSILWFSRVIGKWDLDIVYMTKSISGFQEFKEELFLKFNSIIKEYKISLLTKICNYSRDYLIGDRRTCTDMITLDIKDAEGVHIDTMDEKLLDLLSMDAQISIVDLHKKLKLSANTIKSRIRKLERSKVILGYRLFLDHYKMGYEHYKLHINLADYSSEDLGRLQSWLLHNTTIIYTNHYINGEDFEIELHLENEQEYITFLDSLMEQFGTIIKDHFVIKFFDNRTYQFLPSQSSKN